MDFSVTAWKEWNETPLHQAAEQTELDDLRALLRAGDDDGDVGARTDDGETPLHMAASSKSDDAYVACLILLNAGADVNARTEDGQTPLHYAVELSHDPKVVDVLLKAGADVEALDDEGRTPLRIASSKRTMTVGEQKVVIYDPESPQGRAIQKTLRDAGAKETV